MTAPLAQLLPRSGMPALSPDALLDRFVSHVAGTGLSLYPAQEEAILELLAGKHVVLATPTGSGKSLVALALHFFAMGQGGRSFYTCPIKALVNEKFFALCDAFGAEHVGMMTGDASINRDAPIICCTAEILANLAVRDQRRFADAVVMDEFHYYADRERGVAWQVPLLSMPDTRFLLMSATLGDVTAITESLTGVTGRECAVVKSVQRPVPLTFRYAETPLHETVHELLEQGRAPIYLVNFTQRAAAEQAQNLMSVDVSSRDDKARLKDALAGFRWTTPFGKELRRLLLHGLGLHHAGLLPRYRRLVERLAQQGLLKVVSGTDTLGVGVNIPIRTVLFTQLCKFDGEKTVILPVRDFQQIAGRAGRKGFDDHGYVVAQAPAHVIENARLQQRKAEGKKVTLQKPPTKGYVHWDRSTFERLIASAPEKLESRFEVSHSLIVNLLQASQGAQESGYRRLVQLIGLSHSTPYVKGRLLRRARALFRSLVDAGVVQVHRRTATAPPHLEVPRDLQKDFSLNHSLSLFLLETLPLVPADSPTYPLDVLSLVESILENPDVVLWAQVDRLKTEKLAELKAQGVEYDQRMAELETITYPKPHAEFIYAHFNEFEKRHPWVGTENIRPKSVARQMFELGQTFNELIKEYGLMRSEGVVLRYLSDAYRTLVQNVPERFKDEGVEDVVSFLRELVQRTDSSLLEEWEAMKLGKTLGLVLPADEPAPRPVVDLAADERTLKARIRAEMHQVTRLLALKAHEELAESLPPDSGWTEAVLDRTMAPYWAEHERLDTSHVSRRPSLTQVEPVESRVYRVRHALLDSQGEQDWYVEGVVDLRGPPAEGPLVAIRFIGR